MVFCSEPTLESRKNEAVNTVTLRLTVCACDVMNRAGMCDRRVYYVMGKPFFRSSNIASPG